MQPDTSQPTPTFSAGQEKPERFEPFRLTCLLFRGDDGEEQLIFAPTCSRCGRPIVYFSEANLELAINPDDKPVPLGEVEGVEYREQRGTLFAFHVQCSPARRLGLWKRCDTVLRSDQRYAPERAGWQIVAPAGGNDDSAGAN